MPGKIFSVVLHFLPCTTCLVLPQLIDVFYPIHHSIGQNGIPMFRIVGRAAVSFLF
jgi:hypothetical protein